MQVEELKQRLLPYVRARFGAEIGFADEPSLRTDGYETVVFFVEFSSAPAEIAGPVVLRLFRPHDEKNRARVEATLQRAVSSLGFPAPRPRLVVEESEPLGAPFMLMERLSGRGLGVSPRDMVATAGTAARLHDLPVEPVQQALEAIGEPIDDYRFPARLELLRRDIEAAELTGLLPAHDWLHRNRPRTSGPEVLCHGDLMMDNVLVQGRELSGLIDWSAHRFQFAEREVDIATAAATWIAFRAPLPWLVSEAAGLGLAWLARRFVRSYEKHAPLDRDRLLYYGLWRVATILSGVATAVAGRPGRFRLDNPGNVLTAPAVVDGYASYFEKHTGVRLPAIR